MSPASCTVSAAGTAFAVDRRQQPVPVFRGESRWPAWRWGSADRAGPREALVSPYCWLSHCLDFPASGVVPREFPQLEGCRKGLGALSSSAAIYVTAGQRKGHFLPHPVTWHHVPKDVPALPPGWDSVQSPQKSSIGPGFRVEISSAADALGVGRTRPLVLRRGGWWHSSPTSPVPEGLGFYVLTNLSGLMVWKWNKNEAYWALFNFW